MINNEYKGMRIGVRWTDNDITMKDSKKNSGGSYVGQPLGLFVNRLNKLRVSQGKKEVKDLKNLKQILNGYKAYGKIKYFAIK